MSFEIPCALLRGSVVCALSLGLGAPVWAQNLVDQPVADVLAQQLQNFDQGRIGGYRQLWGESDPSIDPLIRAAAPPAGGAGLAGALAGTAAPVAPQAGSLGAALMAARGMPVPPTTVAAVTAAAATPAAPEYTGPRSCVTVMVVSGYGAYQSPRVCTRQAATRDQLAPVFARLGWTTGAKGASSETYADANGQVATVFYAPSGVAVEVLAWRNVLNRPATGAAPAAAVFAPTPAK